MAEPLSSGIVESIERVGSTFSEAQRVRYPWHQLVEQSRSEEALVAIEQQMKELPDDPICRLWWVRCQLTVDTLPTTALSAPLDELYERITELPELQPLFCGTYLRTALKLIDKNQYRLAVVMLERTVSLSESVPREDRAALESFFLGILEDEIQRAQLRRENRAYISSLEEKKQALELRVKENAAAVDNTPKKPETSRRAERLNAKKILNQAAEQEAETTQEEEQPPSTLWRWVVAAVVVPIALLTAGWELWQLTIQPGQASLPVGVAMNIELPQRPEMTLPTVRMGNNELDRTLDNVGLRLQKLALASNDKKANAGSKPADDPGIDHDALNPKHASGLTQPVAAEDDELISIANLPEARNAIPGNNVPTLDPNKLRGTKTQAVGSSGRKAPIPKAALGQSLKVDPAGRIYGQPKSSDPTANNRRRRALDGSPLRSYEVEQFDPPLVYTTIARTRVVSAPSLLNETLAELNADTPVHVTARMGRWLELRSTGGKVGYIYSQDARPTNKAK